jgi:hypothetical protein
MAVPFTIQNHSCGNSLEYCLIFIINTDGMQRDYLSKSSKFANHRSAKFYVLFTSKQ